ncbi:MAG: efflux RND transporter permease subunit [Deltaproteobacteria bacterium]|nr:efflux RND transporter permease subunit [Deltaproteobacteria bacterium]
MQWLSEICVRRPVFASVLVLTLIVVGLFGYGALGVDRFPKIDFPFVVVITVLPGAAPEEVETEVTDLIEEAVNTISGIDELRSSSAEGVSQIYIQFNLEKSLDVAVAEVRDKLGTITRVLPKGVDPPVVMRMDPDAMPVVTLSVSSDAPLRDITEYADRVLRRRLENVRGVGQVTMLGGRLRQVNVTVDASRLRSYGLTALDVQRALASQNLSFPGGTVDQGAMQYTLRTQGRVESVAELGQVIITNKGSNLIRVADVATVTDGEEEPETVAILNGRSSVVLTVKKQSGTNTVEVVDLVKDRVKELEKQLPAGTTVTIVNEQGRYIKAALKAVEEHLVLGSLLAALVVLLFLGNWRSTLIAAIAIPTSVISTFAFMKAMGFTLNVLTLLALTLCVGIVIDDAIVVLENIVRFVEKKRMKPFDAAIEATREIGLAVLATTMSLAIIFIPVAFMSGIVGRFMHSFGLTMAFAIVVSMVVSFTLTPMLSARWLKPGKHGPGTADPHAPHTPAAATSAEGGDHPRNFLFDPIERAYTVLLRFCLDHRWVVGLLMVATVASLVPSFKAVNKNFLPLDDESQFGVYIRAAEGTTLRQTTSIAQKAARAIQGFPEVSDVLVTIGDDAGKTANFATLLVKLVDATERTDDQDTVMVRVRDTVLPALSEQYGLRTSVARFGMVGGGGNQNAPLQLRLAGPELDHLAKLSETAKKFIKDIPGTADVDSTLVVGKPELRINLDRNKAGDLGVSVAEVASTIQLMVGGLEVSRFEENAQQYDIFLRAGPDFRSTPEGLLQITVPSRKAGTVRLADVASLEKTTGPSVISRLNRRRQVTVTANLLPGTSQAHIMDALTEKMATVQLDAGYSYDFVGMSKEQAKAGKAFMMAFLLSLIFMYLVLAAQFESWIHPITILLALPLTLPFAILSIILLQGSLNIFSGLGMLVLFGVVKKNGILQIDHANQLKAEGMSTYDAVLQASRDRLRPILMTTVAFVAGMIPLALSRGTGAATNKATSSVIIGGQLMSLVLTLVATPVAYVWFDKVRNLFASRRARKHG